MVKVKEYKAKVRREQDTSTFYLDILLSTENNG